MEQNDKLRDVESELSSLRIEVRKMNEKMNSLLLILHDMRSKYASQLGVSDNQFLDLEAIR